MKNKITGVMINYYFVCKRKLWYFCNDISMEGESENVALGSLIDESSYARENKHISIDGTINIDFLQYGDILHEVKKSKSIEEASIWQVKYYLYYLKKRNANIHEALIDYPLIKERRKVVLEDGDIEKIEKIIIEIESIINSRIVPKLVNTKVCKKCAYYSLCYI